MFLKSKYHIGDLIYTDQPYYGTTIYGLGIVLKIEKRKNFIVLKIEKRKNLSSEFKKHKKPKFGDYDWITVFYFNPFNSIKYFADTSEIDKCTKIISS